MKRAALARVSSRFSRVHRTSVRYDKWAIDEAAASVGMKHAGLTNRTSSKDIGRECANFDKNQGLLARHVEGSGLPNKNCPERPISAGKLLFLLR